tara:strand:+ start:45376 stop:45681 length:306 start_codon:yes stop_codon:yes gene_type:complete
MTTATSKIEVALNAYSKVAVHILLPLAFVLMGMLYNWMDKVDERQYTLQREAITEARLETTERRITNYMDVRLKDVDGRLQLIIRQLEMMSQPYSRSNQER